MDNGLERPSTMSNPGLELSGFHAIEEVIRLKEGNQYMKAILDKDDE